MQASSLVRDEGVAGSNPATPTNDLAENQTASPTVSPTDIIRELRRFMRGKPPAIRHAATTVIYHLIAIARGRSSPQLYAALGENIKRMGGGR
jgi:hypothetical protein